MILILDEKCFSKPTHIQSGNNWRLWCTEDMQHLIPQESIGIRTDLLPYKEA